MTLSVPVLALLALLCLAVGFFGATLGEKVWKRIRRQQGWPASEPMQRRPDSSWQVRHREALDKPRRLPARHRKGGIGNAVLRKARIRTRRSSN